MKCFTTLTFDLKGVYVSRTASNLRAMRELGGRIPFPVPLAAVVSTGCVPRRRRSGSDLMYTTIYMGLIYTTV